MSRERLLVIATSAPTSAWRLPQPSSPCSRSTASKVSIRLSLGTEKGTHGLEEGREGSKATDSAGNLTRNCGAGQTMRREREVYARLPSTKPKTHEATSRPDEIKPTWTARSTTKLYSRRHQVARLANCNVSLTWRCRGGADQERYREHQTDATVHVSFDIAVEKSAHDGEGQLLR